MPPVGHTWREGLFLVTLEAQETRMEDFAFGGGFGCEATVRVNQGQKFTLQTQRKLTRQIGAKLTPPGAELSSGIASEATETLTHEFSAAYEWSYSSKPCQYCNPRIYFTSATTSVYSRRAFGLPLLVSKRVVFDPGPEYEIRANCRNNASECGDCASAPPVAGVGGITRAQDLAVGTAVDRVVFDARASRPGPLDQLATAFAGEPANIAGMAHRYIVDLHQRAVPLRPEAEDVTLLSVDDLDRALGAVRLYDGANELLLGALAGEGSRPSEPRNPEVWLSSKEYVPPYTATMSDVVDTAGMRMMRFAVNLSSGPSAADNQPPTMDLHFQNANVHRVWPVVMLPRNI
jgi:hypothetical protein